MPTIQIYTTDKPAFTGTAFWKKVRHLFRHLWKAEKLIDKLVEECPDCADAKRMLEELDAVSPQK